MSVDRRLTEAARHLAESVDPPEVDLGAVRGRARANRRRTVALSVAAAAAVVALAGIPFLSAGRDSTAPQPATSTTPEVISVLQQDPCDQEGCVKPGLYAIPLGYAASGNALLSAALRIPAGDWRSNGFLHRVWTDEGSGGVTLSVYRPDVLATTRQPCREATTEVAEAATARDLAAQLAALPQFRVVSGPTAVPAFGREAQYLVLETDGLTCPGGEDNQYNLADIYGGGGTVPGGDSDLDPDQPLRVRFWVVELGGRAVVVEARQEGRPSRDLLARLEQVRATLTFGDED
jgi:hypothetical protein